MRHKKLLSGLLLFFMLSCSFWGGEYTKNSVGEQSLPYQPDSIVSQEGVLSEFISQETATSVSQAALLRQTSHRRIVPFGMSPGLNAELLVSGILFALIAFLYVFLKTINRSQTFIMEYIHHKDGQKG